ncbi:MAG: two-component system response regulator [Nitrospirae bacterium RBG_13_39_12]|nr:MAG: two-component system response regulator [Nitrospirae bacterium RBG_13_39_12]
MKKVLVIEDNRDNLLLITLALKQHGYEVISVQSGEEGVETALKERPFFIIMDINLPGIDGIEATKKIRNSEIGNTIPVIAITSYAMLGDREKIIEAGCNGYFEKPIDPLTIVDKVHKIIGVNQ